MFLSLILLPPIRMSITSLNYVMRFSDLNSKVDPWKTTIALSRVVGRSLACINPILRTLRPGNIRKKKLKVVSFLAGLDAPYSSSRNQFLSGADLPSLSVTFSHLSCIAVEDANGAPDSTALTSTIWSSSPSRGRGRGCGKGGGRLSKREDRYCDFCNSPWPCWRQKLEQTWQAWLGQAIFLQCIYSCSPSCCWCSRWIISTSCQQHCYSILWGLLRICWSWPMVTALSHQPPKLVWHTSDPKWLIDSEVSYHMIGNPSCFSNFTMFHPLRKIILADGRCTPALGQGRVHLTPCLFLDDALLVPTFLSSFNP